MSTINNRDNYILLGAIIVYLLVTTVPFIDYLSNWYITMLPVVVMIFFLLIRKTSTESFSQFILWGSFAVMLDYFYLTPRSDFLFYMVRRIITWSPCFIALLCVNQISIKSQKFILQIALIAMAITSITTIRGLDVYEHAARALAGAADQETRDMYSLMNIGGYDFVYALVICVPVVFWMIDHSKKWFKSLNVFILLLFLFCIYKSAYATALIITLIILALIFVDKHPKYKSASIIGGVVILLFAGTGVLSYFVIWISSLVEDAYVADRLQQVALLLQGQSVTQIDTDTSNDRLLLMQQAWNGFLNSPIIGNNIIGYQKHFMSGHSYILDILSASGILGFLLYVLTYVRIFKNILAKKFNYMIFQSRIVWLAFIALAVLNPAFFPIIYLVLFTFTFIINNLSKYEFSHGK